MVKRSKIITQQPKTIVKQKIVDMKSVTIDHPKSTRKLSKTISLAKKVSEEGRAGKNSTVPLYCEMTKAEVFLMKKKIVKNRKITKISHAYKCYSRTYNVEF